MKPSTDISDPRVVKALAHPLRVRILGALEERTASPSDLADELGAPLGNVSYHVRQLHGLGLIKLVKRTPRRGAIEHHYKAVAHPQISDEAWGQVPEMVKDAMIGAALNQLGAHVNAAVKAGGFNTPDAHLSRTQITLDERGWKDLTGELAKMLDRVDRIKADSAKRQSKGSHDGERKVTLAMMLFDSAPAVEESTPDDGHKKAPRGGRRRAAARS